MLFPWDQTYTQVRTPVYSEASMPLTDLIVAPLRLYLHIQGEEGDHGDLEDVPTKPKYLVGRLGPS